MEVDASLTGRHAVAVPERLRIGHGLPAVITVDQGSFPRPQAWTTSWRASYRKLPEADMFLHQDQDLTHRTCPTQANILD